MKISLRFLTNCAVAIALTGTLAAVLLSSLPPARPRADKPEKGQGKAWPVKQPKAGQEVATFAAGCFWAIENMFNQLKGVSSAESGYAGGAVINPSYEQVCGARTGHAEAVNVVFDPKVISYRELVEIFLTMHDPTTLNRQGPDEGPQYRSAIFPRNDAQKKVAEETIAQFTKDGHYSDPIVTKIEPFKNFFRAEDYHLDYYNLNPNERYCARVVKPKIDKFVAKFKEKLKK